MTLQGIYVSIIGYFAKIDTGYLSTLRILLRDSRRCVFSKRGKAATMYILLRLVLAAVPALTMYSSA